MPDRWAVAATGCMGAAVGLNARYQLIPRHGAITLGPWDKGNRTALNNYIDFIRFAPLQLNVRGGISQNSRPG